MTGKSKAYEYLKEPEVQAQLVKLLLDIKRMLDSLRREKSDTPPATESQK